MNQAPAQLASLECRSSTEVRRVEKPCCPWASGRGKEAAKASGHPGSLQTKERVFVDHAVDFLATEVFSPEAVLRLRAAVERADEPRPEDRAAKMTLLRSDIDELQQAIDRRVLTFEKYDNPMHPVIRAAERRIEELDKRKAMLEQGLAAVEAEKPLNSTPKVADILETLPDLRPRSRATARRSSRSCSTPSTWRLATTTTRRR